MGYQFVAVGLSPVLLARGIYVRLVTPRLTEPAGATELKVQASLYVCSSWEILRPLSQLASMTLQVALH
ncbi:MAG: hypothetical protein JRD69_05630 [Deltaproteobacteria bacterium]|nr:hypothetical protein [Deltaproteobacteria bacterium]